jgi:hypothetical protein
MLSRLLVNYQDSPLPNPSSLRKVLPESDIDFALCAPADRRTIERPTPPGHDRGIGTFCPSGPFHETRKSLHGFTEPQLAPSPWRAVA